MINVLQCDGKAWNLNNNFFFLIFILFIIYAVAIYRSDGQLVRVTDCSLNVSGSLPIRDTADLHCNVRSLDCCFLWCDHWTDWVIVSIVNSVKIVNMPQAWLPHLEGGKQSNFTDTTKLLILFHLQTLGAERHIPSFLNFLIIKFRRIK